MPRVELPFSQNGHSAESHNGQGLLECGLYKLLPAPLQEVTRENLHLLEYLHHVPLKEMGIPQFYPRLTPDMQGMERPNLIYPIGRGVFAHICPSPSGSRDMYIPVEPVMDATPLAPLLREVEERLFDYADLIAEAETPEEQREVLLRCLDKAIKGENGHRDLLARLLYKAKPLKVDERERYAINYLMVRDKIGLGVLEPLIQDRYIEDISCSGLGPLFIEHKIFRSLQTSIVFDDDEELDAFVIRLAERVKRPISIARPIVDATLPDGSRINIVYGRHVSQRGSNFTIRKFSSTPLSVLELIERGTLNYEMAAYLSLILEEGMNVFVMGETASGKTTMLNAITTFIPINAKIVTVEDTPEVQLPHQNWVREVAAAKEKDGAVTMFELLKAALRQRPNYIIVGEIRGEEGAIAFQAMQTGHAVMSTFHASSVERLIQRITGNPINIPKSYIDNLNVVVAMNSVRLPGGQLGRRAVSVAEIIGYDPSSDSFSYVEIFRWDPITDSFIFSGKMNSYLLENKIALRRRMRDRRQIYAELDRRARLLKRLHEKGVKGYYELVDVLASAQRQGLF
ncbi:Type IV secretion system protein PtlH [bacterium HR25]|jgi:flagellar protein FlaI|nr:Type IV secretion system protein PtlH [bacterium HR25]